MKKRQQWDIGVLQRHSVCKLWHFFLISDSRTTWYMEAAVNGIYPFSVFLLPFVFFICICSFSVYVAYVAAFLA